MNKLEDELQGLTVTIQAVEKELEKKKNMSYSDWYNAHMYMDILKARRDRLLSEKFRGGIV